MPDLAIEIAHNGDAIAAALRDAVSAGRDRWPDLVVTDEELVAAIGASVRVADDVASAIDSARVALSKRTRTHFHRRIKVVPEELDSSMRSLQSQIDLSLSRLL